LDNDDPMNEIDDIEIKIAENKEGKEFKPQNE
jgi:hypothetical protein